jgi:hypothetical protein
MIFSGIDVVILKIKKYIKNHFDAFSIKKQAT